MARSGFNIRFGYVLWLRHLERGEMPGFAEIGRDVGDAAGTAAISGQAVSGWARRDEAPDSYRNNKALAAALGVSDAWLIEGVGDPPSVNLWSVWMAARQRDEKPTADRAPRTAQLEAPDIPAERPSTKKQPGDRRA